MIKKSRIPVPVEAAVSVLTQISSQSLRICGSFSCWVIGSDSVLDLLQRVESVMVATHKLNNTANTVAF